MDVIRFIRGKDKNLPYIRSVSLKYAYSTRTVPPRSAPSLAMMEDRSGWPVSSALPVTLHQPFPRTPQKPLFGRIGPQQSLGRSRPHSTGRTACSPSFANAGRLLRASTRSPTLGWAFQRSQHCDPKGMRHCGPAQSRCNIVSVPGSPPAAAVPMVLRRVPVPASIYARDFPRLSMVQRRNGAPIPVLRSLKCPTWRWRTSGCAQQSSGVRKRRRACRPASGMRSGTPQGLLWTNSPKKWLLRCPWERLMKGDRQS